MTQSSKTPSFNPDIKEDKDFGETPKPLEMFPDVPLHIFNVDGFMNTIDFVPNFKPQRFIDQFFMVTAGGSSRFYVYDILSSTRSGTPAGWGYTTLTT